MTNQIDNKKSVIAYIRVSTKRQGESGIGLDGQKEALEAYANEKNYRIEELYQDIESGRGKPTPAQRQGLRDALAKAKEYGFPLLVHSWDRLARSVTLSNEIIESGVDIYTVLQDKSLSKASMKAAAVRADHDGKRISERTKEGMAKKKAAGAIFGNLKNLDVAGKKGAAANIDRSQRKATEIADIIEKWDDLENRTAEQVASLLNDKGVLTSRSGFWNKTSIRQPLRRAKAILKERAQRAEAEEYKDDPLWGCF